MVSNSGQDLLRVNVMLPVNIPINANSANWYKITRTGSGISSISRKRLVKVDETCPCFYISAGI